MDRRLRGRDAGVNITNGVKTTVTLLKSPSSNYREQMRVKIRTERRLDSSMSG